MNLAMTMLRPMSRSAEKGAETLVWLATSADVVKTNGGYYVDMEWRPPSPQGQGYVLLGVGGLLWLLGII